MPEARLVGAFHHVSALSLWGDEEYLDHEDVLVCGDDADAKAVAVELARAVTSRDGVDAGRLRIARQLEPLDRRADQHQQALQDPLRHVDLGSAAL